MATIINTRNPWVPDAPHQELREVCMVFETMGPNVLALIKRSVGPFCRRFTGRSQSGGWALGYSYTDDTVIDWATGIAYMGNVSTYAASTCQSANNLRRYNFKGIPVDIVRKVTTHTLIGLDYLHLSSHEARDWSFFLGGQAADHNELSRSRQSNFVLLDATWSKSTVSYCICCAFLWHLQVRAVTGQI